MYDLYYFLFNNLTVMYHWGGGLAIVKSGAVSFSSPAKDSRIMFNKMFSVIFSERLRNSGWLKYKNTLIYYYPQSVLNPMYNNDLLTNLLFDHIS